MHAHINWTLTYRYLTGCLRWPSKCFRKCWDGDGQNRRETEEPWLMVIYSEISMQNVRLADATALRTLSRRHGIKRNVDSPSQAD